MNAESLAALDTKLRSTLIRVLPPRAAVSLYSRGRQYFLKQLLKNPPSPVAIPPPLARTCWGLNFRSPLFNAAGMFKNGDGYELCAAQGAGAYLAGTTTANPRTGNAKEGVRLPFAPYPRSRGASNWLGLPNDGDKAVAARLKGLKRIAGCPVGVSVMGSPDNTGEEKLRRLVEGMRLYEEAGVDFLELNESCPNTAHGSPQNDELNARLEYIARHFLAARAGNRPLPVIVKFSNDTEAAQVPALLELLIRFNFDGVNFGNTSTAYAQHREQIFPAEQNLYDYFTSTFGGGVSGAPLKFTSLSLVRSAKAALENLRPTREFHVIRTGGVETYADVEESLRSGASLVQWFTGYFEAFARAGSALYRDLYDVSAA